VLGSVPWPVKMPPKSSINQIANPKRTATDMASFVVREKKIPTPATMQRAAAAAETSMPWLAKAAARPLSIPVIHEGSPAPIPAAMARSAFGARSPGWRMK
jgi:hypothetical protein